MIRRLVLFGATGDLASRFLLPALATLHAAGELPDGFSMVGASREGMDTEAFRHDAAKRLEEHASHVPAAIREELVRALRYVSLDVADADAVARLIGTEPVAAYLALPPSVLSGAITTLTRVGMPAGSRIVIEKPFGDNLDGAMALNALLAGVSEAAGEESVFRVDHVLGMATVQNLIGLRLSNRIMESVWTSEHIERIEIVWEETLALEGRAEYYDSVGALKDVLQNHMLQILALVAMEPPVSLGGGDLHDRKLEALRSVRSLSPAEVIARTHRARYSAGRLADAGGASGGDVPAYAQEDGVDPERSTETFAQVMLELDSARWSGTPFVLRAGKAMDRRRKGVIVRFRPVRHHPFASGGAALDEELRIGLDGPSDISLHLTGSTAGSPQEPVPMTLSALPPASDMSAYARILSDIFHGSSTLSVRGDEAEEAWRIVTPVLQAWARGDVPMEEYVAGSSGPALADA